MALIDALCCRSLLFYSVLRRIPWIQPYLVCFVLLFIVSYSAQVFGTIQHNGNSQKSITHPGWVHFLNSEEVSWQSISFFATALSFRNKNTWNP